MGNNDERKKLLVLCANLERRLDRKFALEKGFGRICGIPITFFRAVDGESLSTWKLERCPHVLTRSKYCPATIIIEFDDN
jgi:hypothetical protein